jgi:methyl-accepting chemotaxis protein
MDRVVQQNASNAEESASASEEMNAQAQQMKEFIGELKSLVDGSRGYAAVNSESGNKEAMAVKTRESSTFSVSQKSNDPGSRGNGKVLAGFKKTRGGSELVIPFDDSDF